MEFIRKSRHSVFVKMSVDQLDQLEVFKKEMHYVLHDYIEMSICMIDNHLDLHLHKHAKYEELLKLKNTIIESSAFNKFYAGVVKLEYPSFKFTDNDLFLNFIYWSNFFEDDQIAILRLKEYIELQCIDFYLEDFKPAELQQPIKSDNSNQSENENKPKEWDYFKLGTLIASGNLKKIKEGYCYNKKNFDKKEVIKQLENDLEITSVRQYISDTFGEKSSGTILKNDLFRNKTKIKKIVEFINYYNKPISKEYQSIYDNIE